MNRKTKIILGLFSAAIGILVINEKEKTKHGFKEDDINLLLPSFRAKISVLIERMHARGFDPILFDTFRTPGEAEKYAKKGVGVKSSLHILGAAADIISKSQGWNWVEFYKALGEESNLLGLTWGGNFKTRLDYDHVQAIPVSLQVAFKKLTSSSARDLFIKKYYESANV